MRPFTDYSNEKTIQMFANDSTSFFLFAIALVRLIFIFFKKWSNVMLLSFP